MITSKEVATEEKPKTKSSKKPVVVKEDNQTDQSNKIVLKPGELADCGY